MSSIRKFRVVRIAVIALPLAMAVSGCTVPPHMRVREGLDPQSFDTDVRYRTTYYFRTFDYCSGENGPYRGIVPGSDTLYRYRMTGQANALTTQMYFESGTLTKQQIDPFGSNVVYDEGIGRFYPVSAEETKAMARQQASLTEYDELYARWLAMKKSGDAVRLPEVEAQLKAALDDRLQAYTGADLAALARPSATGTRPRVVTAALSSGPTTASGSTTWSYDLPLTPPTTAGAKLTLIRDDATQVFSVKLAPTAQGAADTSSGLLEDKRDQSTGGGYARYQISSAVAGWGAASVRVTVTKKDDPKPAVTVRPAGRIGVAARSTPDTGKTQIYCSLNDAQRGFQILGPEGWRTFDPDERLILAMHSSGKPLIQTLQEYSSRITDAQGGAEALLPLVQENLAINRAERSLDAAEVKPPAGPDAVFDEVLTRFGGATP